MLMRETNKMHNYAVIDEIVHSEMTKCQLDLNDASETLNQNPKQVNYLEVNVRHLVKALKAKEDRLKKLNKMEEATNTLITKLKDSPDGRVPDDKEEDLSKIPFSEMTVK